MAIRYLLLATLAVTSISVTALDTRLEHMVVTAARNPVPLWETGSAVTVISREEIDRRHSPHLEDLLRGVPGLAISRQGGAGKLAQVRVRGAEANQVLVMIDGVEANDLTRDDGFDFSLLTTSDIERIEIVRGPQSSLWGSEALAGTINIITRRARNAFALDASVEAGSFNTKQYSASVGTAGADYSVRLGANHLTSGGTNVSIAGDEDDSYENTSVNLNAEWHGLEYLELSTTARVADISNQTDSGAFTGIPVDSDSRSDAFQAYVGTQARLALLDGRWTHRLRGAWTRTTNEDRDLLAGSSGEIFGDKYSIDYQTTFNFASELPLAATHAITFAVNHEERHFKQRGPIVFGLDPNQDRRVDAQGFAGEYRLQLLNQTAFAARVRHDNNSDFDDFTSFRLSISQRIRKLGTVISAAYGTGQKDPTFFDRFGFSAGGFFPFVGNPDLEPEKSRGWEASIRQSLFSDRLFLSASYFSERLRDEINGFVVDFANQTSSAENLSGKSHRDGIELTTEAQIADQLRAVATYTYLDANEIDRVTGLRSDEIRRPRHQGGLSINYDSQRGNVNVYVSHTGKQEDDVFLPPFFSRQRVTLDDFTLVSLAATWRFNSQLSAYARVDNVLDDNYQEVFGFQGAETGAYFGLRYRAKR